MPIDVAPFRVRAGQSVHLRRWPTRVDPVYASRSDYTTRLADQVGKLRERQNLLYAHHRYAVLLILQAMDAAGKDGVIKHVLSGVNPQGCQVFSFKQPSAEELDHDFLWRTTRCLPERGRIGVFNRSYYEEVLIVKVRPELLQPQHLPDDPAPGRRFWRQRYQSITDLERHLHRCGTRIVKCFLHVSKDEQRRRFLARLEDPEKNWKFSEGDLAVRDRWKDYMRAYETCLEATTTAHAPWYVVPADDKENARLIVSQVLLETLRGLKMQYPVADRTRKKDLAAIRRRLLT